jgi:hypothetical protein
MMYLSRQEAMAKLDCCNCNSSIDCMMGKPDLELCLIQDGIAATVTSHSCEDMPEPEQSIHEEESEDRFFRKMAEREQELDDNDLSTSEMEGHGAY